MIEESVTADTEQDFPWNCHSMVSLALTPMVKMGNIAGRLLDLAGFGTGNPDKDKLIWEVTSRTGLDDFGEDFDEDHLSRLIDFSREEARLNLTGRIMFRSDVSALLKNRLQITAAIKRDPQISNRRIEAPIVITGLPRTGTTLLHRLLAQDPVNRAPKLWEIMHPVPPSACDNYEEIKKRIQRTEQQLCWFKQLTGRFDSIHALSANEAEECIAITAHAFASARFHATYWLPGYESWLRDIDQRPAYRFHKVFLQYLQSEAGPKRWILKGPAHLDALDALFDIYPDACVVQTHRDPVTALASTASLTNALQSPFREHVPDTVVGDQVLRRWAWAMDQSLSARERLNRSGRRILDVYYDEIINDPVRVIKTIYRHLQVDLSAYAETRMRNYLCKNPKDKHGGHNYSADDFGITPGRVREMFSGYYSLSGIGRSEHLKSRKYP